MQLNLDTRNLPIDGNKTYALLLTGAAAIVLNHFGLISPEYVPDSLKGGDWLTQLYILGGGATARSALKKLEELLKAMLSPAQAAGVEQLEGLLAPMLTKYAHLAMDARGVPRPAPPPSSNQ